MVLYMMELFELCNLSGNFIRLCDEVMCVDEWWLKVLRSCCGGNDGFR